MKKQKPTGRGVVLTKMSHRVACVITRELEHNRLTLEEGIAVLSSGVCEIIDALAEISDNDIKELREYFCDSVKTNPK